MGILGVIDKMSKVELTDLVKLLRKLGVQTYRTPELELVLSERPKRYRNTNKTDLKTPQYAEDDTLFWSSSSTTNERLGNE